MNKKLKQYLKFFYRLIQPFFDPITLFFSLPRYVDFIKDFYRYSRIRDVEHINLLDIYPRIHEKTQVTNFDKHYFYQDTWAFKKIFDSKVQVHVDIGSRVDFIGFLSVITKVKFADIRPIEVDLGNIKPIKGDILSLPFSDNSIESLSCLSVAEHIGLGRYGDVLDPRGTEKACKELTRVLAVNGNLYFSLPIGRPRLHFNSHRIHSIEQILDYFKELKLVEFSGVDHRGNFFQNAGKDIFKDAEGLNNGLFWFKKL